MGFGVRQATSKGSQVEFGVWGLERRRKEATSKGSQVEGLGFRV